MVAATTVLRWLLPKSDPPIVQRIIVETEEQLALRNREKLEEAKRTLGGRYVLHPSNAVTRQREERSRALVTRARKLIAAKPTQALEPLVVARSPISSETSD
jgi:ABC-type arginine transport system ATPase subunit